MASLLHSDKSATASPVGFGPTLENCFHLTENGSDLVKLHLTP